MEKELREHLLSLARRYSDATGIRLSGIGRRCRQDSSFFPRIASEEGSFTARTFDEVVAWFDTNWPDGHQKPLLSVKAVIAEQGA